MAIRLDFEIQVEDGNGLLLLRPRTIFGWLAVERLELQIPNISFPLDISGGMAQFRAKKCRALACTLRVDAAGLSALAEARAAPLTAAGFSELRVRALHNAFELGVTARVGADEAQLVTRVVPRFFGRAIELSVEEVAALGLLRRPSWLLAHDLLSVLLGASFSSGDLVEEAAPVVIGLGRVRLQPLDLFLTRALPAAGWKVPASEELRQIAAAVEVDGVRLSFAADGDALPDSVSRPVATSNAGDAALVKSDLGGAAAAYRNSEANERLLSVLSARESTLTEAIDLAKDILARRPGFLPALLTLAAAQARASPAAAAEAFAAALSSVNEVGELSLRLSRATARLHQTSSPERAARFYERVLQEAPGDSEAAAALLAHYQERRDWTKLASLLEASVLSATESRAKARALVALSELYAIHLRDAQRARAALESAVELDAESSPAWSALGSLRADERDLLGAILAFERLVALQRGGPAEARTHARIGALREQLGELTAAEESYARALALSPDEPDLWSRAAALSLRLAVARGDLVEAKKWREGARLPPLAPPEILLELARLEEAAGDLDGALRTLGATVERLAPDAAAMIELARARLCRTLGREEDARAALRAAWRRAPQAPSGTTALKALAQDARAHHDTTAEARWLDELLAIAPAPADAERRGELHAAAREWEKARARLWDAHSESARRLFAEVLGHLNEHAEEARVLAELAASDPTLWMSVVDARLQARDLDGASEALSQARSHGADLSSVEAAAGELAWQRRAWDEVAAIYPSLIERATGAARARNHVRLAMALERQGATDDSRARYREALAIDEIDAADAATAWQKLAELEERAGAYPAAAQAWSQAATDARTGDAPDTRAEKHRRAAELLHRRLGLAEDAVAELELALTADAAHLPSLDLLEAIQSELGNDDALAATLRKRLLLLSGDPRRRELVRRLAELDSRRGDKDGARNAWQWVLEQDPADSEAMRQLVDAALRTRDPPAAARWADALPKSGLPDDERRALLLQLAELLLDAQPEAAERALASALALNPPDRTLLIEKRVRALLERLVDPVAALAIATDELSRAPEDARLLQLVAETAQAADEPAVRADALVRLLPTMPSPVEWTHLVLEAAEIYAGRLGDTARAHALYERVLDADPALLPPGALKLAAKRARGRADEVSLLQALRDVRAAGVDELSRLAQLHVTAGRLQDAAEVLADAVDRHVRDLSATQQPLDERGRSLVAELSAAAAASGDHASVARGLARATEIEADAGVAASQLGEASLLCRTHLDDWTGAALLLERALARRPDSALLLADFEAVMRRIDDPERLRRAYAAHLSTQTGATRAPLLARLAQLCETLGDKEAATQYLAERKKWEPPRSTMPLVPTPPDPSRGRALFLAISDQNVSAQPGLGGAELIAAISELRKEVDSLPARAIDENRTLRLRLAWMYRRAGDIHAARVEFERLVAEEPRNRALLAALAETSLLDERWQEAVATLDRLQRLLDSPSERATMVFRMGEILRLQLDDHERAAEEYLRAADLDPDAREPLWRLVDHFWTRADDTNLIDIARALAEQGALATPSPEKTTQARAWVALALDAFDTHKTPLTPPPGLEDALTAALGELAERVRPPSGLASAARRLALATAVR